MLSRDELGAWLRLAGTPGLPRAVARRLLAALGSAERVLAAPDSTLLAIVGPDVVQSLRQGDPSDADRLDTTCSWLAGAAAAGIARDVIVLGDARYPALLLETPDPPLLLYTLGRAELLASTGIAIVGSRSATPQGMDNARSFARFLSEHGLTIVSGLAMGIDGAAHEGGLAGRGSTVAFVGTGLDRAYPVRHAGLMQRISAWGLVASEYPLGTPPVPLNFPRRNRLIAGITLGTLVVEAAVESGSLITARMALECGREVFAIPGSIHSPQASGCHRLIHEGAKLVERGADVLAELRLDARNAGGSASLSAAQPSLFAAAPPSTQEPDDADAALRTALGHDPVSFDVLSARTGMTAERLAARLLDMELAGVVDRLPGGLLQRRGRA